MTGLSERARAVEQSSIRVMFVMAEASDQDLVRLEVGGPDFDTPEHIVDAAHDAAQAGHTRYTSNAGLPELREAIGDTMRAQFDVRVDPEVEASSLDVAKELLADYGVVLAPGDGFGEAGEGQLRLSFANDLDRIETGFDRIERFFDDR